MMRIIPIAISVLLATTMTAGAQMIVTSGGASRIGAFDDPLAARDGCINYPGQAHNSADCGRILAWDPSWVVPNKPLSEMTGAEENMVRTYNILVGKPLPKPPGGP